MTAVAAATATKTTRLALLKRYTPAFVKCVHPDYFYFRGGVGGAGAGITKSPSAAASSPSSTADPDLWRDTNAQSLMTVNTVLDSIKASRLKTPVYDGLSKDGKLKVSFYVKSAANGDGALLVQRALTAMPTRGSPLSDMAWPDMTALSFLDLCRDVFRVSAAASTTPQSSSIGAATNDRDPSTDDEAAQHRLLLRQLDTDYLDYKKEIENTNFLSLPKSVLEDDAAKSMDVASARERLRQLRGHLRNERQSMHSSLRHMSIDDDDQGSQEEQEVRDMLAHFANVQFSPSLSSSDRAQALTSLWAHRAHLPNGESIYVGREFSRDVPGELCVPWNFSTPQLQVWLEQWRAEIEREATTATTTHE